MHAMDTLDVLDVDDADSVYSADTAAPTTRAINEPFGIVLAGSAGKLVDEAFDEIDAEEMSSDEEMEEAASPSASASAHTDALTDADDESLDPISDDDALHLRSVRISDDASPRVTPHASLITPSSSSGEHVPPPKKPSIFVQDVDMTSPPLVELPDKKALADDDDEFYGVDARLDDEAVENENYDDHIEPPSLLSPPARTSSVPRNASAMAELADPSASAPVLETRRETEPKRVEAHVKKSSAGGFGMFSTFYRAFKKPSKTKDKERAKSEEELDAPKAAKDEDAERDADALSAKGGSLKENGRTSSTRSVTSSTQSVPPIYPEQESEPVHVQTPMEKAEEERHLHLEQTLKSQIATLRSARSGFVDLALLTPMTEKTLAAVEGEATRILSELPEVDRRKEEVARKVEILELSTEAELSAKEQILVMAKMKLVEARCDLQMIKHDLLCLRKTMAQPKYSAAAERLRMRGRREKVTKELRAAVESRDTMQHILETRQGVLRRIRSEVGRLENSVKDLEGEWE